MFMEKTLLNADDAEYKVVPLPSLYTLAEAAAELRISTARLSRVLRVIGIPVYRKGYVILLDEWAMTSVQDAIDGNVIRRGPKRKSGRVAATRS